MAMIVGPSTNDGVELRYQMAGCGLLVGLHDVPEVPKEGVHILWGGFDKEFPRVFPDILSQEIETVLDVGDMGFCLGELQTTFVEKVFH
jgi:hypothetical protein